MPYVYAAEHIACVCCWAHSNSNMLTMIMVVEHAMTSSNAFDFMPSRVLVSDGV